MYWVANETNYHWVKRVAARTNGNGVLKIQLHGDEDGDSQFNMAEINIFTNDELLTARLVEAINGAAVAVPIKEIA